MNEYSVWTAATGCTACARRIVFALATVEYDDVLIGNAFLRALAPEFRLRVLVFAVDRTEDHNCYR